MSRDTVSRITDKIVEEIQAWWARPLERVYAAIFIDAIVVKGTGQTRWVTRWKAIRSRIRRPERCTEDTQPRHAKTPALVGGGLMWWA